MPYPTNIVRLAKAPAADVVTLRCGETLAANAGLKIEREAGIIRGVSVITRGPAIGHGFDVDDVMLRQVAALINAQPKGVKSRLTHCDGGFFGGGKDAVEVMVGRWKNAVVDGDRCRADVHLGKYADSSPSGMLRTYLLSVAEEDPEIIGPSIVFVRAPFEERRDEKNQTLPPAGRVAEVLAVDFVGDPGANPAGMLNTGPDRASALQKEIDMDPALLAYLKSIGLKVDATKAETKAFLAALKDDQKEIAEALAAKPAAAPPAVPPTPSPAPPADATALAAKKAADEAVAAERKRAEALHGLATEHGLDADWAQRMISAGRTAEEAKALAEELKRDRERFRPIHVAPGTGRPNAVRVLSCAAMLGNAENVREDWLEKQYGADVMTEAAKRRRISLKGLIAAACAIDGRPAPLLEAGPEEWLAAGFSTVSLPGILGDSANKSLLEGYQSLPALVPIFFGKRTVTNFREYTEYRMTGDDTFEEVGPAGELPHGTFGEEHEHYQAKTYGRRFAITRTMLVNDDLGAFLQIPRRFGRGAALAREEAGAKLIMDNTGSFFVAGHKNLSTGAGTTLTSAGLTAAVQLMEEQVDADGNPVMVLPALVLVPPALKGTADELYKSANINTGGAATTAKVPNTNIYQGRYQPYSWPYLGNTTFHASASSAYWYLFADPANVAAFLVAYLNGVETPTIEEVDADSSVLGRVWRAWFDFGVSQGDYRAAVRSNGA
jgi:ribosomal protein L12E/L44/L45/RPP1/RPP2